MTGLKKYAASRACVLMLLALLGLCLAGSSWAGDSQDLLAQSQAKHWLGLLDKGNYDDAYRQAAPVLQQAVTPAKWRQMMIQLAAKTGPSKGRKLLHGRATQDLPGAPKNKYYIAVFEPNFARQPKLLEQVALILGSNGQWRVAGYYLK
ncbi:MAG: DUF4019 domain-containing protein [Desulfarculaceae bacterium]|nr:DUF4019 domain-containing protein [Desulfarculaceae bacterium]MCF8047320.1 DUF4019 domain-containing protein [Desulfarculaceae bacterium]MCF8096625.1 DUF4019 domain-containing protein [Desulfarculaceae bacterium]MCF8122283.1 DUF4019 domain-containing protein [Desulfarculaceae bacterium]